MSTRILAITGARDGCGRSTFAVNAALCLLKETHSRVLLLDLDRNGQDCAELLGLQGARTLLDFAPYAAQLKPEQLGGYISAHPAGMGVLPALPSPERAAELTPAVFAQLFGVIKPLCDYIVVDCGSGVDDLTVQVMEQSAGIFVLSTPDIGALNATRRYVDQLQRLQFPRDLIKIVLNRTGVQGEVSADLVTQKLGRKVMVSLPEEYPVAATAALTGKPFVIEQPRARLSRTYDELLRQLVEKGVLDAMLRMARPQGHTGLGVAGGGLSDGHQKELESWNKQRGTKAGKVAQVDGRTQVKMLIHKRLVEVLDLKKLDKELGEGDRDLALRTKVRDAVARILDEVGAHITDRAERQRIVKEVVDEALGLGPLEDLLADDSVTEVMVNGRANVFVERKGKLVQTDLSFTDDAQLLGVIERIVAPIGRRIDEKSPMVDARLRDGSRVNAIIPPLALDGPTITIRKFAREPYQVKDLVNFGSMTTEIADFLRSCVEARLNILISGGTGSGKTTLLNVMSSFIPADDRIVTVEDSAELQLKQPHVVRLETRPPNIEGVGAVTIRDLVRNSLRMRPDRIVVGECRGAEALDMLQAMNTGHDGSLTTVHSNSPRDCIARLETLVMFAGLDLPSRAIREQIAAAVNVIVQQSRMSDGTRKITAISEVTGMEGPVITLQDIFVFKQEGVDENRKVKGRFIATGFIPKFVADLEAKGIALPKGIFAGPGGGAMHGAIPRGRT